jgi:hypothetical protein
LGEKDTVMAGHISIGKFKRIEDCAVDLVSDVVRSVPT